MCLTPCTQSQLILDGERINRAELKLLGEILRKSGVSLVVFGIDVEQLAEGMNDLSYEEIQYVLKDNPTTNVLSANLKEELATSKSCNTQSLSLVNVFHFQIILGLNEEKLYKEAMVNDRKILLSYTKLLALGPGQVGKSTFLYRLMGLMKGNILTSDPKTQPQSSTGIAEMREACITYTSRTGALTSENWQVFDESSDLQCFLDGLMSLLSKQALNEQSEKLNIEFIPPIQAMKEVSSGGSSEISFSAVKGEQPQQQEYDNTDIEEQYEEAELVQDELQTTTEFNASFSVSLPKTSYPLPQQSNIDKVIAEFESLQTNCKLAPSKTKFRMLFNIADIGGQPAFLEMLPSLTIGPALYLVFMKLLQGLTTRYPVAFKCKDGRGSKLCKNYTYTSEEVIFTALSSIACFGNSDEEVEKYVANTGDQKQTNSLALLVGTFRDEIKDEISLENINSQLEQRLKETDFFKDGLIHSKSFLEVNNYSAPENEIESHRKLLEDILEKKFRKYEIPTRWLILSICLKLLARLENKHEVSFNDCVRLGSRLGMAEEMVKVALQFLHKYIGLVMYFPKNNHLKNIVICDPQVVFSSISELIFDIYDPRNMYITEAQHDRFVRTGCFSPQEIKPIDIERETAEKKLLSIDTLVHLLVHLNIIAEVPLNLGTSGDFDMTTPKNEKATFTIPKKYYFLPAVLQTAELSNVTRETNEELLPDPLCIRFKTGYLPLGFVCALSANLIAQSNLELIPFEEDGQQITYKNKIRFRFQGRFDIVMISYSKYCEFHVSRCSNGEVEFWNSECCPRIRSLICEAADRVIHSMQQGSLYKLSKGYELAFKCPHHPTADIGHEPLAKVAYNDSKLTSVNQPSEILCVVASCKIRSALSPEMNMWFGEVRLVRLATQ